MLLDFSTAFEIISLIAIVFLYVKYKKTNKKYKDDF